VQDLLSIARRASLPIICGSAVLLLLSCGSGSVTETGGGSETPPPPNSEPSLSELCQLNEDNVFAGGPGRDGIPALVNPTMVPLDHPDARYLDEYARLAVGDRLFPEPRVVGLIVDGTPIAIPHNILWWHEIVNADLGGRRVTISYCPLTGSAVAFDATEAQTNRFGVSGLIFQNNLIMFDEETQSLWPQLCLGAGYGPRKGTVLTTVPTIEMRWESWKKRHPNTLVISDQTGFQREYTRFPYGSYESLDNDFLVFPGPAVDERRPAKERVLGIPDGLGGVAFPFTDLADGAESTLVKFRVGGREVVVLWDSEAQAAAGFFGETLGGAPTTLRTDGRVFTDRETGSTWDVEGLALTGPMAGSRLRPIPGSTVVFWFAWTAFHPETVLWTAE
jgi:hypothetical protein